METTARVVIIGGGVVGCSILFHLARFGWTDSVLLERNELTSGSIYTRSWKSCRAIQWVYTAPAVFIWLPIKPGTTT